MNTVNDNWLESLAKHPIFELNDVEKQQVGQVTFEKTRNENSTVDFLLQNHSQALALRDNDLFVAVGSTIRVLDLVAFKDNWLKTSQAHKIINTIHYKILDTPEINFAIEALIPNKNGKLLAVKGKNRLAIVCLPRQSFGGISQLMARKKVECRTLSVGAAHYENSKIIKAQWHPLSETDTHLVVLDDGSSLKIFNISEDIDDPEQHFDLSPTTSGNQTQRKGGFSFNGDNKNNNVVSFSLGGVSKDQSNWEPFSVFYTLRNGEFYVLSPVLPYKSRVRRNHLENLAFTSKAKYDQAKCSESDEKEALSYLFKLQIKWLSALFRSAEILHKTSSSATEGEQLLVTSSKNHSIYPVQRQGPFVTKENVGSNEASDILYINADPVHVLVLTFTNGTIHNYILGTDIDAQWQISAQSTNDANEIKLADNLSNNPQASLYESIDLKSHDAPKYQCMTLIADPLYEDTYFVYHATGIHAVSLNKWIQILRKINSNFESSNDKEAKHALDAWLKNHDASDIRLLVDSSPFSDEYVPIIGLIVIPDVYLSYSLLAITRDYQLVNTELLFRRLPASSKKSQEAVKEQLKHISDEHDDQSLLPLPAYQIPPQLESLPTQTKVVMPTDISKNVTVNEETLRFLSNFSEKVLNESANIKKNVSKIHSRLSSQQSEFQRQVKSLRNLNDMLQKVDSDKAKDKLQKKTSEILENHAKLRLRIDQQLHFLMQNCQKETSKEEEIWIEKLETLVNQVNGDGGYATKIAKLQSQLKELSMGTNKISKTRSNNIDPLQLKSILRSLNEQSASIEDVTHKFKRLESKVSLSAA